MEVISLLQHPVLFAFYTNEEITVKRIANIERIHVTNIPLCSEAKVNQEQPKKSVSSKGRPSRAKPLKPGHTTKHLLIKTKKQVKEGITVTAKIHIFLPLYLDYTDLAVLCFGS